MLYCLIGFIVISLLGTSFHYFYDWFKHNKYISMFFAVNESTWEHLKLAVVPIYLWAIVGIFLDLNNFAFGVLVALVTVCVVIPLIFYTYTHFTKKPILVVDITSFFVAVLLAMFFAYLVFSAGQFAPALNIIAIILNFVMLTKFIVFTYYPPKIFLFKDPITNKYGLSGHYDDARYGNNYKLHEHKK